MKVSTLPLLPILVTSKVHTKQITQPFPDDPAISILSPEHPPTSSRQLQNSNQSGKQCADSQALWTLALTTDNNPAETKWTLKQLTNNELMLEGPPSNQEYTANSAYNGEICILKGYKYVFRITDEGGDGLCCDEGTGGFTMSVNGNVFVDREQRDEDWDRKSFLFHVGNLTESMNTPEVKPSRRPTPKPTVWEVPTATNLTTPQPTEELNLSTSSPVVSTASPVTPAPTVAKVETSAPTDEPEEGVAISFILMADSEYILFCNCT